MAALKSSFDPLRGKQIEYGIDFIPAGKKKADGFSPSAKAMLQSLRTLGALALARLNYQAL
ncbi:MAG: hypothetical protein LW629_02005 [Burkholderiales bacterium]|nr:hypothetical protein [Burkholderiales bacterium]